MYRTTIRSVSNTNNLSNGGYIIYWGLYRQLIKMLSEKNNILSKIKKEYPTLYGEDLNRKVNRKFFFFKVYLYTWMFVWSCLIKPLGQFFSRKILIKGSYKIPFENINLEKSTTYKIFGIPFWYSSNQKLTKEDVAELIK